MIIGRDLINGYQEEERIYSTGNDELDDLMERAFCEGYEFAQREFAEDKDDEEQRYIDEKSTGRGYGTALIIGRVPGVAGRAASGIAYKKSRRKGKSRKEAEHKGNATAALVGGGTGAALGALLGCRASKKISGKCALIGSALGAAGGYLGSREANKGRRLKNRNRK